MMKFLYAAVLFLAFTAAGWAQAQKSSEACPPVKAKNSQEALKMEGASNKKGCWKREKNGNLVFVGTSGPTEDYKPLLADTPEGTNHRRVDPTVGLVGSGDLAGEWRVQVIEYDTIDNGTDGKYEIFCRDAPGGYDGSGEGIVVVGWDNIPKWKCTNGCKSLIDPFWELDSDPQQSMHLPPFSKSGPGIYSVAGRERPKKVSFEHEVGKPYTYGIIVQTHSYKIVVTGNTFVGFLTVFEDQTPENGHREVACYQQIFHGERILPKIR
jgi:hypothetical protein